MKNYILKNVRINGYVDTATTAAGNVVKKVCFTTEDGHVNHATTARNSSAGYDIVNAYKLNKRVTIEYHITRNNNIIIDFVRGL